MGPRIPWGRSHALDVLYVARLRGSGFDPPAQAGGFFRRQGIGSILGFLWPWEGDGRGQEAYGHCGRSQRIRMAKQPE